MLGYSKEKFGGLIARVDKNTRITFVTLYDKDGEMSFMEIPFDDMKNNDIECKAGIPFSLILRNLWGWERLTLKSIKRVKVSQKEINKMMKYYEEKYGDV